MESRLKPPVRDELIDIMDAWQMPKPRVDRDPQPPQTPAKAATPIIPGIELELTGDALVKGVIFSEILGRRPHRRIR